MHPSALTRLQLATGAAVLALSVATSELGAITLAEYQFGQPGPQTVATDMTASNVTPNNLAQFNTSATSASYFAGNNPFLQVAPNVTGQTDPATAFTNNNFWSVTLTPAAGYFLDIDELSFTVFRGGASGIRGYAIYSSVDSFTVPLQVVNDESGTRANPRNESLTLSSAFDSLVTPVTFRFYIHSLSTGATMEFDNLKFSGQVALIPEPASLLTAGVAGLLLLRRRRRR